MKVHRQLLRAAALPILDRKWAAPLSAVALGFGLFVGVAIGPGAAGTLATGATEIIEIPGVGAVEGDAAADGGVSKPFASGRKGDLDPAPSRAPAEPASSSFAPLLSSEPESSGVLEEPEAVEDDGAEPEPAAPPAQEESEPGYETLAGLVVHLNEAAASYVVAGRGGEMTAVHAATAPQPGTQVEVPIRPLANGTFAEAGKRVTLGKEEKATLSGIVTYVDPDPAAPVYTVSKRGVSMLVHVHPDPTGAAPELPLVGVFARATVELEDPLPSTESPPPPEARGEEQPPVAEGQCAPGTDPVPAPAGATGPVVWQRHLDAPGTPLTYGDFSGIVSVVCADSNQLLISADDVGESGEHLLFEVPEGELDLLSLEVGSAVLATAAILDGKLSLTGLASDEHRKGADDRGALQGDLAGP